MQKKSEIIALETTCLSESQFSSRRYLSLLLHLICFSILLLALRSVLAAPTLWLTENLLVPNLIYFAAFSALTFSIQRLLLYSGWGLGRVWRYRLAFLVSAGLGICFWFFPQETAAPWNPLSCLASAIGGAFAGALLVTAGDLGLVEVNSPPPQDVKNKVAQQHQELIRGAFPGTQVIKYFFDMFLALLLFIVTAPAWLVIAFLIWWEDPGPIFFIKNSVGQGGINFLQLKFRTMIWNAENETGPILASKDDKRLLSIGRLLRKGALDELPQIINILRGQMSFVGPRPQRTVLVNEYIQDIPRYALRHRVRPGLAGLAQVAGHYYVTPLQKLRYDRIYIRHMSLWFDMKILLCAFLIVFWLRWQKNWDGDPPPWLIGS
jgi:lipopolysaccharide/colanic/teichoic acid biosynthesis glycosyltransferase